MRRIYISKHNSPAPGLHRAAYRHPRRTGRAWGRLGSLVLACLLSYAVAHLVLMDIAALPGAAPLAAMQLGQIIALAILPMLVVLCFGAHARHGGLYMVAGLGITAALVGAVLS